MVAFPISGKWMTHYVGVIVGHVARAVSHERLDTVIGIEFLKKWMAHYAGGARRGPGKGPERFGEGPERARREETPEWRIKFLGPV